MKCTKCGAEFEGNFCPNCGARAQTQAQSVQPTVAPPQAQSVQPTAAPPQAQSVQPTAALPQAQSAEKSRFTGGAFANFGISFLTILVTIVTLSLAYPAMKCWKMRWEVRHTYINGRQLTFDGKARQLYGKYLLWLFLSVITLGIYFLIWMPINLVRWQTKHTHVSGAYKELGGTFEGSTILWALMQFGCLILDTASVRWDFSFPFSPAPASAGMRATPFTTADGSISTGRRCSLWGTGSAGRFWGS